MISISEHITQSNPNVYLTNLTEEHWINLNPISTTSTSTNIKYLASSLFRKIDNLIEKCSEKSYLEEIAYNDTDIRDRHLSFFIFLQANNYEKLKQIIVSKPNELLMLRGEIMNLLTESDLYTGTESDPTQTKFGTLLSTKLFDYSSYRKSPRCIETIEKLELNNQSCPYCNLETIDIVEINEASDEETQKKALLDLDHFMPKAQNPFFALSFFNLVPTCIKCNGRIKKTKPFSPITHVNPFDRSFNDIYTFKFNEEYTFSPVPFECQIISKDKADQTVKDLLLEERYQEKGYKQGENLVKKFKKYRIPCKEDPETLLAILFDDGYSKETKDILRYDKGKLMRDLLRQIDVDKILID